MGLCREDSMQLFSAYVNLDFYQKACLGAMVVIFYAWKGSKNVVLVLLFMLLGLGKRIQTPCGSKAV